MERPTWCLRSRRERIELRFAGDAEPGRVRLRGVAERDKLSLPLRAIGVMKNGNACRFVEQRGTSSSETTRSAIFDAGPGRGGKLFCGVNPNIGPALFNLKRELPEKE